MKKPFVGRLFSKLARKAGVRVHLEPHYGIVGQIVLPRGRTKYFRNTNFDLNPLGATEVAKDKDYAAYFMRGMDYPVVEGKAFYADALCHAIGSKDNVRAALRYARRLGFPVIVKPNSLSKGVGVTKVMNPKEFRRAARAILKKDNVMLMQRVVKGKDYRIVVLDKNVLSAYERLPLQVVGDGKRSIRALIAQKQKQFVSDARDTVIHEDDARITQVLRRKGLRRDSILKKGECVVLLDNANLSSGGDARDVTDVIHSQWKKLAVRLTRDMGLRYSGVDVMTEGDIRKPPRKYKILEINAAPGIDNYAASGKKQARIVEDLYLRVLRAMKR